jgi:NADH-quinone oxidoreductase subunit L
VLIPLFPLLAAVVTALFGAKVLRERSHWPTIIGCGAACVCALALLYFVGSDDHFPQGSRTLLNWTWMHLKGSNPDSPELDIQIGLHVDSLSATMLAMVTFISTLIAIYASGYMHAERGYWRFFAVVSLFLFSMIGLVLSANFLQLFMFWEAVGLCSYLLIGFWYEKPEAAKAGMKAFITNRVGDFGFAVGVFLIWTTFGDLGFEKVLEQQFIADLLARDPGRLTLICLCLFTGAVGKSAQFPLHVWLPDAMEGPTPVSALIHAATMVTAGVYMVARCTPLFMASPDAQLVVSCIGGFTALLAALIALTQTDLKRVLAYSTVSQLGYMFLGLGTGLVMGISGAMFHLITHAFFKALLFLGAGSVMHAMGGVIDMRQFRGLKRVMPQTYWTFLIGSLALAGLFPLSGFWSKDTILAAVYEAGHGGGHAVAVTEDRGWKIEDGQVSTARGQSPEAHDPPSSILHPPSRSQATLFGLPAATLYTILFWMGSFTALLTAFYTFRAFFLTFHGPEKIPHEAGYHAHESPPVMCIPLWILAVGAACLGAVLGHATGFFDSYLGRTVEGAAEHHEANWFVIGVSTVVALVGIIAGWMLYSVPSELPGKIATAFGPLTRLSQNKFYIDEVYAWFLILPLRGVAQFSRFFDWFVIDGALVDGLSKVPGGLLGRIGRPMQNGLVQFYAVSMLLATVVLLLALLLRQG